MTRRPLYVIVATSDEVIGPVDRSRWPAHTTVVGNFHLEAGHGEAAARALMATLSGVRAFDVVLGPSARFGKRGDVPVLIAEHQSFHRLHAALVARLESVPGFAAVESAFWGSSYRPHVTLGTAVDARLGQLMRMEWMTLVVLDGGIGRRVSSVHLVSR